RGLPVGQLLQNPRKEKNGTAQRPSLPEMGSSPTEHEDNAAVASLRRALARGWPRCRTSASSVESPCEVGTSTTTTPALTIILVCRAKSSREFNYDQKKPRLADRQRYPLHLGWTRSLKLSAPFLCFNRTASRRVCLCQRLDLSISCHLRQRCRPPRF